MPGLSWLDGNDSEDESYTLAHYGRPKRAIGTPRRRGKTAGHTGLFSPSPMKTMSFDLDDGWSSDENVRPRKGFNARRKNKKKTRKTTKITSLSSSDEEDAIMRKQKKKKRKPRKKPSKKKKPSGGKGRARTKKGKDTGKYTQRDDPLQRAASEDKAFLRSHLAAALASDEDNDGHATLTPPPEWSTQQCYRFQLLCLALGFKRDKSTMFAFPPRLVIDHKAAAEICDRLGPATGLGLLGEHPPQTETRESTMGTGDASAGTDVASKNGADTALASASDETTSAEAVAKAKAAAKRRRRLRRMSLCHDGKALRRMTMDAEVARLSLGASPPPPASLATHAHDVQSGGQASAGLLKKKKEQEEVENDLPCITEDVETKEEDQEEDQEEEEKEEDLPDPMTAAALIAAFPWGRFLAEGSFKRVYEVVHLPTRRHEAISVTDVAAIRAIGLADVLSREVEASVRLAELAKQGIPNFIALHGRIFRMSRPAPALLWGDESCKAPGGDCDLDAACDVDGVEVRDAADHEAALALWAAEHRHVAGEGNVDVGSGEFEEEEATCQLEAEYEFVRMELCPNGDLEEWLKLHDNGTPALDILPGLMFQMAAALLMAQRHCGLRHYDVKLLNFLLGWHTTTAARHDAPELRYVDAESGVVTVLTPPSADTVAASGVKAWPHGCDAVPVVKLIDFGTSDVVAVPASENASGSRRSGAMATTTTTTQPVLVRHFATLENTAMDLLLLGDAAKQGYANDVWQLGLCFLHLLTGEKPYEEILEEAECPAPLIAAWRGVWETHAREDNDTSKTQAKKGKKKTKRSRKGEEDAASEQFSTRVIQVVADDDPENLLSHTLWRYLVLLGLPTWLSPSSSSSSPSSSTKDDKDDDDSSVSGLSDKMAGLGIKPSSLGWPVLWQGNPVLRAAFDCGLDLVGQPKNSSAGDDDVEEEVAEAPRRSTRRSTRTSTRQQQKKKTTTTKRKARRSKAEEARQAERQATAAAYELASARFSLRCGDHPRLVGARSRMAALGPGVEELLLACLAPNPDARPTMAQIVASPVFAQLHGAAAARKKTQKRAANGTCTGTIEY